MRGSDDLRDLIRHLSSMVTGKDATVEVHRVGSREEAIRMLRGEPPEEAGIPITAEQAMVRVTEFYALVYAEPAEDIQPGDIIYHKMPELAEVKDMYMEDGTPNPHVMVELVSPPISGADTVNDPRHFGYPMAANRYDCKVGGISYGGREMYSFSVFLSDIRLWTKNKPRGINTRR